MAVAPYSTTAPENPATTRRAALLGAAALPALAVPALAQPGPAAALAPPSRETLEAYSTWLFYERRRLMVEMHGREGAHRFAGFVRCDNPAFYWHFPSFGGDGASPSTRAAPVLALAGVPPRIPTDGPRRSPTAPPPALPPDPLLEMIREYDRQMAIFERDCPDDNAAADALRERTFDPVLHRLETDPPAPTTFAGAVAGLGFVENELREFADHHPVEKVMGLCVAFLRDLHGAV